jgi:hypothetical protein
MVLEPTGKTKQCRAEAGDGLMIDNDAALVC